jgi:hypothetical protein
MMARGELTLQPQQTLLVTGFNQLVDEGSGGGEADRKALLAGGKTNSQREVGPWDRREGPSRRCLDPGQHASPRARANTKMLPATQALINDPGDPCPRFADERGGKPT